MLDPNSFEITSQTRRSLWELESNLIWFIIDDGRREIDDFNLLGANCLRAAGRVQQSVEIQQEDHGKAILVFTTVTIIFLPLTFVSGLLGMNTIDIRNSNNTQWLFWVISIPLTVIVVISALLIGYHGDRIREFLANRILSSSHRMRKNDMINSSSPTRGEEKFWNNGNKAENLNHKLHEDDNSKQAFSATSHSQRRRRRRTEKTTRKPRQYEHV